jgi:hypothetical protein
MFLNINELKKGGNFYRKRRYIDAMYYGETKEGKDREGKGIMIY